MVLCFNCDEKFTRGYKCKHLFNITLVNISNGHEVDPSLMMMISAQNSSVCGWCTMFLVGSILGHGMLILVDTGAIHNILDINFA